MQITLSIIVTKVQIVLLDNVSEYTVVINELDNVSEYAVVINELGNVSQYAVVINELHDTNLTCSCLTIAWHQTLEEMAQDVTI